MRTNLIRTAEAIGVLPLLLSLTNLAVVRSSSAKEKVVMDSVSPMVAMLPTLSQGQPKPLWQKGLSAQEADFIRFVSSDRVLIGTAETGGYVLGLAGEVGWAPQPKDLMLLNAATGEPIWISPRASFGLSQRLLSTTPVILLQGNTACGALNPKDGAHIWERPCEEALLLPDGQHVVLRSRDKKTVSLSAFDIETGNELWTISSPEAASEKANRMALEAVGAVLLVVQDKVVAISAQTGRTLWTNPFPGGFGADAVTAVLGDDLYFTNGPTVTRTAPASGSPLWQREFAGQAVQTLSMDGDRVLVLARQGGANGSRDALEALDRASGKPLWRCELGGQTQSAMTIQQGRLYLTTVTQVNVIDLATGSITAKAAIPDTLQAPRLLPDTLRITEDRIVVARETGVMAVRQADGTLLFAEPVAGESFTSDYAVHRLNRALRSVIRPKKRSETGEASLASYSSVQARATRGLQEAEFRAYQARLNLNTAVQNTSWREIQKQASFQNTSYAQAQVNAYAAVAYSSMANLVAVEAQTYAAWRQNRTAVMSAQIAQTLDAQGSSLQSNFYIRPRYEPGRGWSLVLVELNSGRRFELLLSPDNHPLALSAPNLQPFAIDPSGSRIVSKGLGLDPTRFTTYEVRVFTPNHKFFMSDSSLYRIPYASVLSFDLAALAWAETPHRAAPSRGPAAPEKKQLNDRLLAAVFGCDTEATKKALDAGAEVNGRDQYGQTALMLAAESLIAYKKADVVKLLLERGADPSLKDPDGWTAADHFTIMGWFHEMGATQKGLLLLAPDADKD
jgi:outer membrane protein assembly factor BamB